MNFVSSNVRHPTVAAASCVVLCIILIYFQHETSLFVCAGTFQQFKLSKCSFPQPFGVSCRADCCCFMMCFLPFFSANGFLLARGINLWRCWLNGTRHKSCHLPGSKQLEAARPQTRSLDSSGFPNHKDSSAITAAVTTARDSYSNLSG